MEPYICQGVVLKAWPHKDWDLILSLFTGQYGIIKVYIKGGKNPKRLLQAVCTPLTLSEFVLKSSPHSEFFQLKEATVLQMHLALRENLASLQAASEMTHALEVSQLPGKPDPLLFSLLCLYLHLIPANPMAFAASFYLKILLHEGLLLLTHSCPKCGIVLAEDAFLAPSGCYCPNHRPQESLHLEDEELFFLLALAEKRSSRNIAALPATQRFLTKIRSFFMSTCHN